jgi:hypothetical protein
MILYVPFIHKISKKSKHTPLHIELHIEQYIPIKENKEEKEHSPIIIDLF